jgi:hypothetical protein
MKITLPSVGAQATKAQKMKTQRLALRKQLWPKATNDQLWVRTERKTVGFITVPRTMPLIMSIMDDMSNGKPLSLTYLALWCRSWDESIVMIANPKQLAFESGFSGQRAELTWGQRMKLLSQFGFIDHKPGSSGTYSHILIWNPYRVIKQHHEKKTAHVQEAKYNALLQRAHEIGAIDLSETAGGKK